jgi:hypothetical protein
VDSNDAPAEPGEKVNALEEAIAAYEAGADSRLAACSI